MVEIFKEFLNTKYNTDKVSRILFAIYIMLN